MTTNPERPVVVDLFAGAGGLSLGFEQAGFDVGAAVELDPIHAAAHEFNFPYSTTVCADVRDVTGDDLRRRANLPDEITAVVGGAPCQGFSLIGKRALDDPRNGLVAEFGRLVIELQPRYFVLENVAGLTVGKHRWFLQEVMGFFESNGYEVRHDYQVLQASEFGVPQSRKRLFLLGARRGEEMPSYPDPLYRGRTMQGTATDGALPLGPSVSDALGDIPNADDFAELLERDWTRARFGSPTEYARLLRDDAFPYARRRTGWNPKLLTSSTRTIHTPLSRSRFAATEPGRVEPVSRFLRLHPDGVSNTLRAGTASDRGAFTSPRPIHPVYPRCITVREAARLHGYPDWFRFHVTKWHGFRQIGNSVPPPLARAVAEQIMKAGGYSPAEGSDVALGDGTLLTAVISDLAARFGVDRHVIPPRRREPT